MSANFTQYSLKAAESYPVSYRVLETKNIKLQHLLQPTVPHQQVQLSSPTVRI